MPLYEFYCEPCRSRFEEITSFAKKGEVTCPKCKATASLLISKFAVAGQGDLRESSDFHGCHSSHVVGDGHGHDHD